MANLNPYPSIEYAMADAREHLGAAPLAHILRVSESAIHKGCNANSPAHNFNRLSFAQVREIAWLLHLAGKPEHFSPVLQIGAAPKSGDIHRTLALSNAEDGDINRAVFEATSRRSPGGELISPNEAAAIIKAINGAIGVKEALKRLVLNSS